MAREKVSHGRPGLLCGGGQGGRPRDPSRRQQNTDTLRGCPPHTLAATAAFAPGALSRRRVPQPQDRTAPVSSRAAAANGVAVVRLGASLRPPRFSITRYTRRFCEVKNSAKESASRRPCFAATGVAAIVCDLRKNFLARSAARPQRFTSVPGALQVRRPCQRAHFRLRKSVRDQQRVSFPSPEVQRRSGTPCLRLFRRGLSGTVCLTYAAVPGRRFVGWVESAASPTISLFGGAVLRRTHCLHPLMQDREEVVVVIGPKRVGFDGDSLLPLDRLRHLRGKTPSERRRPWST